jgi:3',5'-cyclic AMP phosphodiesterase CpdA
MTPWILHLSDPHLGQGHKLDDDKDELEGQPDLETSQRVFERTLKTLSGFVSEHGAPEVVVVSGDLTYRNSQTGFERFVELLTEDHAVLPKDHSRIVVVPGNHDVDWDEEPGAPARYTDFLQATRDIGCVTPLLDGVDFDPTSGKLSGDPSIHHVQTKDFLVVPFNSSNYCGVLTNQRNSKSEDEWREELAPLGDRSEELMEEIRRGRQVDMARISRSQIEALGEYFARQRLSTDHDPDQRLRIAVLHHQLLPISTREERKPYESLVDLGLVRETLRDYEFGLVLHGHKHESGIYWDTVTPADDQFGGRFRRILVISSPGDFQVKGPTMRAILSDQAPSARNISVFTFGGAGANRVHPDILSEHVVPLWTGSGGCDVKDEATISASGAHVGYSRLRSLFALRDTRPQQNLVCEIDDPSDAGELPPDYPTAMENPQAWFSDLVSWWQKDRSELVQLGLTSFNHGERIRRRWGDQIDRAIRILGAREGSSRALVTLVAPRETGRYEADERSLETGSFPAFVLAEFSLSERDGKQLLDCVGYFRKQEMQFWWPVNLAELALLQKEVRDGLRDEIGIGRIVTFAAIALWEDDLPRVAVPILDRLLETPGRLMDMALSVAFPDADLEVARDDWVQTLVDLKGNGRPQPPRPQAGTSELHENVSRLQGVKPDAKLAPIVDTLEELRDQYAAYPPGNDPSASAVKVMIKRVEKLEKAVSAALGLED